MSFAACKIYIKSTVFVFILHAQPQGCGLLSEEEVIFNVVEVREKSQGMLKQGRVVSQDNKGTFQNEQFKIGWNQPPYTLVS